MMRTELAFPERLPEDGLDTVPTGTCLSRQYRGCPADRLVPCLAGHLRQQAPEALRRVAGPQVIAHAAYLYSSSPAAWQTAAGEWRMIRPSISAALPRARDSARAPRYEYTSGTSVEPQAALNSRRLSWP